jgi:CDK-activating kinase assembly factor MAT1
VPKVEEGPTYVYQEPPLVLDGPITPTLVEVGALGFIQHIRPETPAEKTGGFKTNISCLRALQDAMAGLFHGF